MEFAKAIKEQGASKAINITRSYELPSIQAFYFHTWEFLGDSISVDRLTRECIFSDLSLGPWKGHWLGGELCRQLVIDLPENVQPIVAPTNNQYLNYADTVGKLIDNESGGDRNFNTSYALARRIIEKIVEKNISWVLVIAPIDGKNWGLENIQLIRLLKYGSNNYPYQVGIILSKDAKIPSEEDFKIDLKNRPCLIENIHGSVSIPGIIDPTSFHSSSWKDYDHLVLDNGDILISPNQRSRNTTKHPILGLKNVDKNDHIKAYLELQQANQNVNFLQREAGRRFSEGAYDVSFHILDSICRESLSEEQIASIESQKQSIRIALMDFENAAEGSLPSNTLPDVFKASLLQSKAWGLVMTNRPEMAEPLFKQARKYLAPLQHSRLYLYLLNISALNKLRLGDVKSALKLEKEIEKKLYASQYLDWHILYINCINQARLYKKVKDFRLAVAYYQKAFAINYQLKNESDLLYTNLCFAQLSKLEGNNAQSFIYWLRSCIHWLSNATPEALAPRVAQAILSRSLSEKGGSVEEISYSLLHNLLEATNTLGIDFEPLAEAIPFTRISFPTYPVSLCMGDEGWCVYGSKQKIPFAYVGKTYEELHKNVLGILNNLLPECDISSFRCFLTDTQNGVELPSRLAEVLWSCLKWNVPSLVYKGQHYDILVDEIERIRNFKVSVSPAINFVEENNARWIVHFKRYKKPLSLHEKEKDLLQRLAKPLTLGMLQTMLEQDLNTLRPWIYELENKRLVTIIF